jgi:ATP-dependent RNA helicase DeaD
VPDFLHTKALVNFLLADEPSAALIFTKMKVTTEEVAQSLREAGMSADCLHGDLSQQARNRILGNFKEGKLRYLVATDVAARGIDVADMPLVVHMGIPTQLESYIHRSGRTGRAGAKGASLALVNFKESRILLAWARRGGLKLDWRAVPGQAEIREARTRKLAERVQAQSAPQNLDLARTLLAGRDSAELVAALLSLVEGPDHAGFDIPETPRAEYSTEKRAFKPRSGERPGWTPGQKPGGFRREGGPDRPYRPRTEEGAGYRPRGAEGGQDRPYRPNQGEKRYPGNKAEGNRPAGTWTPRKRRED